MNILKNYIQFDADGYFGERKLYREDSGDIHLEMKVEMKLIPFAMDVEKQEFIIFMISRKNGANLFLWVYFDKNVCEEYNRKQIRITPVNELMLFTKWSGEPMDVSGNYPEEIIVKAMTLLQSWQDRDIFESINEYEKRLNETGGYERWKKEERDLINISVKAKKETKGIMYMY